MVTAHLYGRSLSGFSPLQKFSLPLLISSWESHFLKLFSHTNLRPLSRTSTLLIDCLYTDHPLVPKIFLKIFFLTMFSEIIQFNLKIFYTIAVFDMIWYGKHYKVRIKGKVEQSRERRIALPYTLV